MEDIGNNERKCHPQIQTIGKKLRDVYVHLIFFCASNLYNYSLTTRLPHLPPGAVMPMAPSSYILAHEAFVKPIIVAKFFSVLFLLFENA